MGRAPGPFYRRAGYNLVKEMSIGDKTGALPMIADFIRAMVANPQADERRKSQRVGILMAISARPVDAAGKAIGEAIDAVTHNISAGGLALLTNQPVEAQFLELELGSDGSGHMRFVLEVLRTRRVQGWCYEVAGRFITSPVN